MCLCVCVSDNVKYGPGFCFTANLCAWFGWMLVPIIIMVMLNGLKRSASVFNCRARKALPESIFVFIWHPTFNRVCGVSRQMFEDGLIMFVLVCIVAAAVVLEEGPVYWHAALRGYRSEHDD